MKRRKFKKKTQLQMMNSFRDFLVIRDNIMSIFE